MPRKPFQRYSKSSKKREVATSASLAKLFQIERYDRNELSISELNRLRDIIDTKGLDNAAEFVGVDGVSLLRACAGFAHRLMPRTAEKLRKFLRK